MSLLSMTDDGDLDISSNQFVIVKDDLQIRQRILQNLRTFLGEWFLDNQIGTPYYQIIFVKGAPATLIGAAIKEQILDTEGVFRLESFDPLDLDVSNRQLRVKFSVLTVNGQIVTVDEPLP